MCLALECGHPRFTQEFAVSRATQESSRLNFGFNYAAFTLFGLLFHTILLPSLIPYQSPTTPLINQWFGLAPFRSSLTKEISMISFPLGTKIFQFPRFPPALGGPTALLQLRLPYSDTAGSQLLGSSPTTFVAWYVLLRHPLPRHPPFAL